MLALNREVRETSSESKENIRGRHYLSLLASLNVLEMFELSVVGAEFLLVVVHPVSPITSQLQPPSRHSDISWSHHGDRGLR